MEYEIGKTVKRFREQLGITQDELAKKLGYKSRSSINKIELGENDIPRSKISDFAKALGTTPQTLMGWDEDASEYGLHKLNTKRFRVLGKISCGEPIWANEEYENYIDASADIHADFCLIAKGDSMINARIFDGDIVFIRTQPDVDNGQIAAVVINDEATLKRVYKYPGRVELRPENPTYAPLNFEGEELNQMRILGKAVAFMSNII